MHDETLRQDYVQKFSRNYRSLHAAVCDVVRNHQAYDDLREGAARARYTKSGLVLLFAVK